MSFVLRPQDAPQQTIKFPTLYPASFTVSDDAGYFALGDKPLEVCILQDEPSSFHAVQRSRLRTVVMPLDRGLSDTNAGEETSSIILQVRQAVNALAGLRLPGRSIGDSSLTHSTRFALFRGEAPPKRAFHPSAAFQDGVGLPV